MRNQGSKRKRNCAFDEGYSREIGSSSRPDLEFTRIDTSQRHIRDIDKLIGEKGKEYKDLADFMVRHIQMEMNWNLTVTFVYDIGITSSLCRMSRNAKKASTLSAYCQRY